MIHTIHNPKLVRQYFYFKNKETFTGVVKDTYNNIAYLLNGKFHRIDGPAVEYHDGNKYWYLNNIIHRAYNFNTISWSRFIKLLLLK